MQPLSLFYLGGQTRCDITQHVSLFLAQVPRCSWAVIETPFCFVSRGPNQPRNNTREGKFPNSQDLPKLLDADLFTEEQVIVTAFRRAIGKEDSDFKESLENDSLQASMVNLLAFVVAGGYALDQFGNKKIVLKNMARIPTTAAYTALTCSRLA